MAGLFSNFPYCDVHQINLDYCIKIAHEAQEHLDGYDDDMAAIAQAKIDAVNAANSASNSETVAFNKAGEAATSASNAYASEQAAAGSASDAHDSELAAAGSASDAYNSELAAAASESNAHDSEVNAAGSEQQAEAWAAGTINGTPVAATAPQYQNNALYYANDAAVSAGEAAGDALDAEAWAVGTKNNVPVTYSDIQYNNNAKYWSDQAQPAAVQAYYPNSMGAIYYWTFTGITVKAARTATPWGSVAESINVPGLIAFRAPVAIGYAGNDLIGTNGKSNVGNVRIVHVEARANNKHFIAIPWSVNDLYLDPKYRTAPIDGFRYAIYAYRLWDIDTETWAADDTAVFLDIFWTTGECTASTTGAAINGDFGDNGL